MELRAVHDGDDLWAIADIFTRSWKAAYVGIVPQDVLDGLSTDERYARFMANGLYPSVVLVDGAKYMGIATVHAARDQEYAGWGEVVAVYMQPEYFGRGLGERILRGAERLLTEMGHDDIYLWALKDNARARRFYEKMGYELSGDEKVIEIGGCELREVRYVRG